MSLQISGLASGMDIDSMVSELMKAEKTKLTKLEQDKQIIEWKQERYNDLNKDFANFVLETREDFGLDNGVTVSSALDRSDWVKSATSSDESVVSVSSNTSAIDGSYDIKVTQLADNFSAASDSNISSGDKTSLATQFSLDSDNDVIEFTIETEDGTKSETFTYSSTSESKLNETTLKDVVSDINNADLGVTAIYESEIDRFFLQTDDTGKSNNVKIHQGIYDDGAGVYVKDANHIDFLSGAGDKLKLGLTDGDLYEGQNAKMNFNGATGIEKQSNNFEINGINFNLKGTSADNITVNVDTDVDSVYEKIEGFIEKYNKLVVDTRKILGEKRYRDYKPLSDEEKQAMSDDNVELWEEKAKSGLLKNDMIIQGTMDTVRSGMYQEVKGVDGQFDQLTEIGITTESWSSGTSYGKLTIKDPDQLKEAISEDVDSVLELFFKQPEDVTLRTSFEKNLTSDQIKQKREESGLINRLYDNLAGGMQQIIAKSGPGDSADLYRDVKAEMLLKFVSDFNSISMLTEDMFNVEKRIVDMNDRLNRVESRYYSEFTAMEQAINKMNSQSSWLSQQMG
ncbi:MAG: hypothetical protein FH751_04455 [Firmicutes bacterium]|nr:hypothetical protein [Bacillota bacterium]